jgi:hypothetical protein
MDCHGIVNLRSKLYTVVPMRVVNLVAPFIKLSVVHLLVIVACRIVARGEPKNPATPFCVLMYDSAHRARQGCRLRAASVKDHTYGRRRPRDTLGSDGSLTRTRSICVTSRLRTYVTNQLSTNWIARDDFGESQFEPWSDNYAQFTTGAQCPYFTAR